MGNGELLQVDDLTTAIDTPRGTIRVVEHVSFSLDQGETLGIVGESGSGKSMLARSIMGLLAPGTTVSGRISFDGRTLAERSPDEQRHFWGTQIAMIFQDPMTSLNPVKRVGVAITESLRFHLGMSRSDARARAIELLEQVGIPEPGRRIRSFPHELSGGMRQRVMIAMALACRPRLLIADEPTTALDVTVQRQILDLLQSLQQLYGMSLVLISHELGVVAGRTDRVAVMYGGQFVEVGSTIDVFESTRHRYTEALLDSIPRLEAPSGRRLQAISGRPPSPFDLPTGCRFSPRCAHAREVCSTDTPPMVRDATTGHEFACHFPADRTPSNSAGRI